MTLNDEQAPITPIRIIIFVLACVLAVALPLLVMRTFFVADDAGTNAGQRAPGTPATATSVTPSPAAMAMAPSALAAEVEKCRLANLRHQTPLSAADVSLAQFDKHIDAMNLLVAGKISLSVATTFWDETRVKAVENVAAFRRADKELSASATICPVPDAAVANAAPYGQVVAIKSCASAITARNAALARARTAVTTWDHHVHDMEMLRMGHLTPAQATAAWKKSWKTGERQLSAYEKDAVKATKTPCSLD